MSHTMTLFEVLEGGDIVLADASRGCIVVWNGSTTLHLLQETPEHEWEEIDCWTIFKPEDFNAAKAKVFQLYHARMSW